MGLKEQRKSERKKREDREKVATNRKRVRVDRTPSTDAQSLLVVEQQKGKRSSFSFVLHGHSSCNEQKELEDSVTSFLLRLSCAVPPLDLRRCRYAHLDGNDHLRTGTRGWAVSFGHP